MYFGWFSHMKYYISLKSKNNWIYRHIKLILANLVLQFVNGEILVSSHYDRFLQKK